MMKKISLCLSVISLSLILSVLCFGKSFEKNRTYSGNFLDVPANSWFAQNVASVYELGLMEGVTQTTFDIDSEMSVAQAITIAARLHSIYNDTQIPESANGGRWFQKYVDYAVKNNIMQDGQFNSYTRSVLSYEMVMLFANALPAQHYPAINNITYIQDVPDNLIFHNDVMLFYNAGVLNGNDNVGTFLPMSAITRKRAAVILSRTALPAERLNFSLDPKKERYTGKEVLSILDTQTVKDTLDTIYVASSNGYNVSAAEYRYYSSICASDKTKIDSEIAASSALYSLINTDGFTLSYDALSDILAVYYNARVVTYGNLGYFDALESQNLTDSVYAKLTAMDEMVYYLILNESNNMTPDKVYEFAVSNNYICAKHILIQKNTEDSYRKALEINLAILDGADFDELLVKHGEDPGMIARQYGYFFTKGQMVEPFETAAYALEEGQCSSLVEPNYGYHIIKRMPMDKSEFAISPDYANIMYTAASASFYNKLAQKSAYPAIYYIKNFDEITAILK